MSNNNNKLSGIYSWPVIILALIFFWPLGLFLVIKRTSLDKRTAMSAGGKGLKVLGIVLAVIGALAFIGLVSDPTGDGVVGGIIMALFFIGGGVALILKSKKIAKEADAIKHYLSIIVNGGVRQLDSISATTGKPYEVVKKDVRNMIDKGFLKNSYINESTREIVFASATPVTSNTNAEQPTTSAAPTATVQTRVVACPCCGANNTVSGALGECEYCGTPLK